MAKKGFNFSALLPWGIIGGLIWYIWNKRQIDYDVKKQVYQSSANILVDGVKSDLEKLFSFWK